MTNLKFSASVILLISAIFCNHGYAGCLSLDKPVKQIEGTLNTLPSPTNNSSSQHSKRPTPSSHFVFLATIQWCNADEDLNKIDKLYIPLNSLPWEYWELVQDRLIQGTVVLAGKLNPVRNEKNFIAYVELIPQFFYVDELGVNILDVGDAAYQWNNLYTYGSSNAQSTSDSEWIVDELYFPEEPSTAAGDPTSEGSHSHSTAYTRYPAFPSPVPTPSKRKNLQLFSQNEIQSATITLADAENKIAQALSLGGYEDLSYFSYGNGFALATPLEQTDVNAVPLDDNRWVDKVEQSKIFSIASFLKALFLADKGYFRVLVFVIDDQPIEFGEKVDKQELMLVVDQGSNRLPQEIARRKFSDGMLCTALVYEFEHDENTKSIINKKPGRHSVKHHLSTTDVITALQL